MQLKVRYYFLFLLFSFIGPSGLFANETVVPASSQERKQQIEEYLSIAKSKVRIDIPLAWDAAQKAKALAIDFDESKLIESDLTIAQIYQQKGALDTALLIINDAIKHTEALQEDTLLGRAYHILGLNYQYTGSTELAVESYHKALKINESLGLHDKCMKQLNNIGLIYSDEEEYDLALEYLERGLKISKEKGFQRYELFSYGNIGYILMAQEKWEEALERLDKTLGLAQYMGDTLAYCSINYLLADIKMNLGDYRDAEEFAQTAINLADEVGYAVGKTYAQRVLSDIYLREKKYTKARKKAEETLQYIKGRAVNLYLEDVLNVLYKIEYETGNYREAIAIKERIYARKDSLSQVQIKERISNSEYKYKLLQNEQEKQLLTVEKNNSHRISVLAVMIALLLATLMVVAYIAYRKSRYNNEVLEQAIKERTKELANSNENLAKSNEELERFAYIASHDLKTPLREMVSFTGLLERRLRSHEDEKVHEYLSFIKQGGVRLNKLIKDTLEYSRVSAIQEQAESQDIDLNKLFEELENSMSNYLKSKNAVILKPDNLPIVHTDHSHLVLLFQNLIENGVKYNNSDKPVIKVYTKTTDSYFSVFIEDNGIGIPDEFKEEIFVMFSRLHNNTQYEGTGLGLSICKKIITKLNGEIHVTGKAGQGSIFEVRLPGEVLETAMTDAV